MSQPKGRPPAAWERRRSQRVLLSVPVLVSGKRANGAAFEEHATTAVVNAHGALVLLRERVLVDQKLQIQNSKTGETMECQVADINPSPHGVLEVGVRFAQPTPQFWHIAFPPVDWSPHDEEARRYGASSTASKDHKNPTEKPHSPAF